MLAFSRLRYEKSIVSNVSLFFDKTETRKNKKIDEGVEDGAGGVVFRIGFRVELDFYVTLNKLLHLGIKKERALFVLPSIFRNFVAKLGLWKN